MYLISARGDRTSSNKWRFNEINQSINQSLPPPFFLHTAITRTKNTCRNTLVKFITCAKRNRKTLKSFIRFNCSYRLVLSSDMLSIITNKYAK